MQRSFGSRRAGAWVMLSTLLFVICSTLYAEAERQKYISGFVGTLTTNRWHEALQPHEVHFADSHMVGAAVGWEHQIGASRVHFGLEAQLAGHFGRQDHLEITVPVVLRLVPDHGQPLRSVAGGLGLSYATDVPEVEIDRSGASQRFFVHWMAELEFGSPDRDRTTFVRLHHRSDGYGVFDTDAGSTGFVFGVRQRF